MESVYYAVRTGSLCTFQDNLVFKVFNQSRCCAIPVGEFCLTSRQNVNKSRTLSDL
jgi:hypothetical protein